jgi:AGZA family xanthine/uracil permease-like MFS transporter
MLGTSTVTSYVESASGVAVGGRTGLTALSTAVMFLLALFLAPLFLMVPAAATAPALILVGLFMITSVVKINFDDMTEAIPAFLTIVMMPFAFSIAQGIVFGMLSFVILKAFSGQAKHISVTMWVIFVLFIGKMVLDGMHVI